MRNLSILLALLAAPALAAAQQVQPRITIGESFSPKTGEAALRNFRAELPPVDSGGECSVMRTGGNGATLVSAAYPARKNSLERVLLVFDSVGHLVRYSESRGESPPIMTTGMSDTQRDSALRAAHDAHRQTTISFDWALDQAVVTNRGGGRPTDAVLTNVRAAERLESLGVPADRIERVRKLCGV